MAKKAKQFRVDFFDVKEMQEGDLALIRSVLVSEPTKKAAKAVVQNDGYDAGKPNHGRFIFRCEEFAGKLGPRKKNVYKSIESLYGEKKALKIMTEVEAFRLADTGTFLSPLADTSIVPASGPDSAATVAVVADLAGMTAHDAHEQTMDTFQPETARLPENLVSKLDALDHAADSGDDIASAILSNEPLPAPTAVEVPYEAGGFSPPATDGLVLTSTAAPQPQWKETLPLPTWLKLLLFGGVTFMVVVLILAILNCKH